MSKSFNLFGKVATFGLTVAMMTSCSSSGGTTASPAPSGSSSTPAGPAPTINIGFKGVYADGDRTNNPVLAELQKKTNTVIKVQEMPDDSYVQKSPYNLTVVRHLISFMLVRIQQQLG